jgi:hypothetical protein
MYANAGNVLDHPRAELDQALAYRCEFSVRQWVRLSLALDRIERPSRGSTLAELASAAQQTVEERRRAAVYRIADKLPGWLGLALCEGRRTQLLRPQATASRGAEQAGRSTELPSHHLSSATVQTAPSVAASAPLLKRFNATRCSSELKRSG